jgi:hypothetical protein
MEKWKDGMMEKAGGVASCFHFSIIPSFHFMDERRK